MATCFCGSRQLKKIELDVDLAIVGGGMAGVCAAIAAARNGSTVALIHDRPVLGGNASSEIRMHIVGADCHGNRPGARESGLLEELRLEDAVRNPYRCYSLWDLLLYEKVISEKPITLLLETSFISCETDGGFIKSLIAIRNSTEDLFVVRARYYADCSGDSRLGAEAGAAYRMGRESREEFAESLAPPVGDRQTLGSSILITARRHDTPQPFHAPHWIRKFSRDDLHHRPIHSYEYGYWWFEWGGQLDTIKDNPAIRHELLRIALGIWDYIKNSGDHPDSAHWALDWVGAIPGKRESRRLVGPHILTEADLMEGRIFPDAVAFGGWAIDLHPPAGVDARDEPAFTPTHLAQLYTIPLRSLFSINVSNLFFAGRNISASHIAFASTRVMGTCAAVGQAVGTAAAIAARNGKAPRDLVQGKLLEELQQTLLRDDAFIPAVRNRDGNDLARSHALISASSFRKDHPPESVVDGIGRELTYPNLGGWADGKPHCWESAELPAWIEIAWNRAVNIREIHITFDTGFGRELILSSSDYITGKVVRGPQPETVKKYQILADGREILREENNFLRKRVHRVGNVSARKLRLEILATHGIKTARVFEIRVY